MERVSEERAISVSARLRSRLGDERLMLRISGTVIGYVQILLFAAALRYLSMPFPTQGDELLVVGFFIMLVVCPALLVLLLYYVKRIGAVTLIFSAFTPLLTFFLLGLSSAPFFPFFEPVALWYVYNTTPVALLLIGMEYLIKLFLARKSLDINSSGF